MRIIGNVQRGRRQFRPCVRYRAIDLGNKRVAAVTVDFSRRDQNPPVRQRRVCRIPARRVHRCDPRPLACRRIENIRVRNADVSWARMSASDKNPSVRKMAIA